MPVYNIGPKTQGADFNFFQKVSVTNTGFVTKPDLIIPFSTRGVMFLNEGSGTVEVSFNGNTVHDEFDSTNAISKSITYNNRTLCMIWFRVKTGSSGPIVISTRAWAI